MLTRLRARSCRRTAPRTAKIEFTAAFADEPEPLFDPEDSLRDNDDGWADYTRLSHPRHAVFAVDEPVDGPRRATACGCAASSIRRPPATAPCASAAGGLRCRRASAWTELVGDPGDPSNCRDELRDAAEAPRRDARTATAGDGRAAAGVRAPHLYVHPRQLARQRRGGRAGRARGVPAAARRAPAPIGSPWPAGSSRRRIRSPPRVMVNRLWQELFGIGLVETAEDFGTTGTLAVAPGAARPPRAAIPERPRAGASSRLLRDLVLSATYRQEGTAPPEKLAADPRNRLLARGPRTRLIGRDGARPGAGALGPLVAEDVRPAGHAAAAGRACGGRFTTAPSGRAAEGEDRYRRAVYTYWKRTSGYPSLLTFDAPSRDVCVARRIADQHAAAGARHAERPGLHRAGRKAWPSGWKPAGADADAQIAAGYQLGHRASESPRGKARAAWSNCTTRPPPRSTPIPTPPAKLAADARALRRLRRSSPTRSSTSTRC